MPTRAESLVPVLRSQLYVPGNRPEWMRRALTSGADGLILDLEDAVPAAERPHARRCIREFLDEADPGRPVFVRVNSLETESFLADLEAVVRPRLAGVVVPKVSSASDVRFADRTLSWLEERNGLALGTVLVTPLLETAAGMRSAYAIGCASPRIAYMGGLGVKGGDVERALGYRWSKAGLETLAMRSQILLDVRAAGVPHPLTGVWTDIQDLDGLRAFAEQGRDLGYEGMTAIHPGHIATINEVFSVSSDEVDYYRRLIAALEEAAAAGRAAVRFEGELIDTAMVRTARERLAFAQAEPE
jgi:citrate lyase subunit beta/citryl-CoA lyase